MSGIVSASVPSRSNRTVSKRGLGAAGTVSDAGEVTATVCPTVARPESGAHVVASAATWAPGSVGVSAGPLPRGGEGHEQQACALAASDAWPASAPVAEPGVDVQQAPSPRISRLAVAGRGLAGSSSLTV